MKTLLENLANLLKVKTIITIVFTLSLAYCYLTGRVSNEIFVGLVSSVITYYFARKGDVSRETDASEEEYSLPFGGDYTKNPTNKCV